MYYMLRHEGVYWVVQFDCNSFGMVWHDKFRMEYVLVLSYRGAAYTYRTRELEKIEEFLDDLTGERP